MGNVRPPQRRKQNTFASPSSSLLSPRPFAPTTSPPSSSLLPKDQPASPVQVKGFSYSFERMAVHHPAPEVTTGNESEPVASGETTNLPPRQPTSDAGLLVEQDQPMPTTHGNESPAHSSASALQRMRVPTSNPVTPPPVNRRAGTKRSGWSIERIAITHNPLAPAQRAATNDAPGIQTQTEVLQQQPAESATPRENTTGLPDHLKTGIESLSGLSLDDVHVHYNSSRPAQVDALAYTQGTEIHVGPGQEQHLAHEAWHVVQQKEGRVQPTVQTKGVAINDDQGLEREADVMGERAARSLPSAGVSVAETMTALPETMQLKQGLPIRFGTDIYNIQLDNLTDGKNLNEPEIEQLFQRLGLKLGAPSPGDKTTQTQKYLDMIIAAADTQSINYNIFKTVLTDLREGRQPDLNHWQEIELYYEATQPIIEERKLKRDKATYFGWYYQNLKDKHVDYEALINTFVGENKYGLTLAEAHAVFGYTTALFYTKLNEMLRGNIKLNQTEKIRKLLESALSKLPSDTRPQYRGMTIKPGADLDAFLDTYKEGNIVPATQFLSASTPATEPHWSSGNVRFEIKPTNARDISALAFGTHFIEILFPDRKNDTHESLFLPDARFRVDKVQPVEETDPDTGAKREIYRITMTQIG